MEQLVLRELHQELGARFAELGGMEIVADYGDALAEYNALRSAVGVLDLSFRGRVCLTGADRLRFLHGQVTNDVKRLRTGEGCYAAITTAKGKMEGDLNIYCLQDELLLDFEPGLTARLSERLGRYLVADDVQIVDAGPHYGLLSVQGPKAEMVVRSLGLFPDIPAAPLGFVRAFDPTLGEIYLMNNSRIFSQPAPQPTGAPPAPPLAGGTTTEGFGFGGFDLFVPNNSLAAVADKLVGAAKAIGGRACGWQAFELARIEAGIPRFGIDMDETNLPLECGIEGRAISYAKGCYIGQEVLNRVHSFGHVAKELRGLRLAADLSALPQKGDKLFREGREVGYVTSAVRSPALAANLALAYIRREANQPGTELTLRGGNGDSVARIVKLPFATD